MASALLNSIGTGFYPFDIREFDPHKCVRMYCDGMLPEDQNTVIRPTGGARSGDMVITIPYSESVNGDRSASVVRIQDYSSNSSGYIRIQTKNNIILMSRSWISDRTLPAQGQLYLGPYEMDTTARVRYNRNGNTGSILVSPRVGWHTGHVDNVPNSGLGMTETAAFTVLNNETTWFTHTCTTKANNTEEVNRINTGINCDEWHTLRVYAPAGGKQVIYSIDGSVVHIENNDLYLPNNPAIVPIGQGLQGGLTLRSVETLTNHPWLDVQWVLIRIFMDR